MGISAKHKDEISQNLRRFLDVAEHAAHTAGAYLLTQLGKVDVTEKNPGDFVTQADFASQKIIHDIINSHFPEHDFLGEESDGSATETDSEFTWIVDPIDGTTNFIHQLPSFSVSIALRQKDEMIVGCIHDPVMKETYSAAAGQGAFLNGQPLTCSKATSVSGSIAVCSLPRGMNRQSVELHRMINVLCDSDMTLRRLGSAALNMCYIAVGRVDSYWSAFAKIWDIAAGVLILTEAGGVITDMEGNALDWNDIRFVASGTNELNKAMIELLSVKE